MAQQKGHIGVTSDNIFPIIKKFLYSDHEIFLRELVSNAVDASNKLKTLSAVGEFKGEMGELKVSVAIDKAAGTITISDNGIGMTAEEIEKYINQIAFSGAEEFVQKYNNDAGAIIGHFGLGFYSAFMVSKKVEIVTLSHQEGAQAVRWSCTGDPEYTIEETTKVTRGTDIVLHIDDDNQEFLETPRLEGLLNKYCKFLTVPIIFGKVTEWKENKQVETEEDRQINETHPAWTKKPSELTDEDYKKFYSDLYPGSEEPLFWIHLNVDFPFNLTGILYFPKVKSNMELQRNKIQLYCSQVFVTDSVEGIVPEFLTLLHGVIDSPDIPLNVSRSYLQADGNVKKISNHITKKVADRLQEIFVQERAQYEEKWDSLKIFVQYGLLTDEKFNERAQKFLLLQSEDQKLFTLEEYKTLVESNQTDKEGKITYLYTTDRDAQYSYIAAAKAKGYDVLLMEGQLDNHVAARLEQKLENTHFVRVDSDVIDNIIKKEDRPESHLTEEQSEMLRERFKEQLPHLAKSEFQISFEALGLSGQPVVITQNEQMRRMKEMAATNPMYSFMGEMPDSYNLVVNSDHPLCQRLLASDEKSLVRQLIDIALLSNGQLKGEALSDFVRRSIELL